MAQSVAVEAAGNWLGQYRPVADEQGKRWLAGTATAQGDEWQAQVFSGRIRYPQRGRGHIQAVPLDRASAQPFDVALGLDAPHHTVRS